jgi:DNA-3-methyladenine glycosylase II
MIDLTATRTLAVEGPFRLPLMLANLRRRPNEIVDLVADEEYHRLLVHQGRPLLLRAAPSDASESEVYLTVHGIDVPPALDDLDFAARALRRVLSLEHSPQSFYDHVRNDPVLGPLTRHLWGLRPLSSPTIFEMLVIAILGQQISLIAAGAIKARMVRSLGTSAMVDGKTYYAHPTPEALAHASHDDLLALAFSRRKAEYIRDLALSVASGALDLEALQGLPHATLVERLIALRGVGRWTAEYVLLRGYGYSDALPAGDAGLRRQIWRQYALPAPPTEAEIIRMSQPWAPYRSWATLYLWNAELSGV